MQPVEMTVVDATLAELPEWLPIWFGSSCSPGCDRARCVSCAHAISTGAVMLGSTFPSTTRRNIMATSVPLPSALGAKVSCKEILRSPRLPQNDMLLVQAMHSKTLSEKSGFSRLAANPPPSGGGLQFSSLSLSLSLSLSESLSRAPIIVPFVPAPFRSRSRSRSR